MGMNQENNWEEYAEQPAKKEEVVQKEETKEEPKEVPCCGCSEQKAGE